MDYKPIKFITESITVQFENPPFFEKKPGCPDRFIWRDVPYEVKEILGEWADFGRTGNMAQNMRPTHSKVASRRGSWGVGKFYFRVLTSSGRIFEIYYDRSPKDVDDRKGNWFIYRELEHSE